MLPLEFCRTFVAVAIDEMRKRAQRGVAEPRPARRRRAQVVAIAEDREQVARAGHGPGVRRKREMRSIVFGIAALVARRRLEQRTRCAASAGRVAPGQIRQAADDARRSRERRDVVGIVTPAGVGQVAPRIAIRLIGRIVERILQRLVRDDIRRAEDHQVVRRFGSKQRVDRRLRCGIIGGIGDHRRAPQAHRARVVEIQHARGEPALACPRRSSCLSAAWMRASPVAPYLPRKAPLWLTISLSVIASLAFAYRTGRQVYWVLRARVRGSSTEDEGRHRLDVSARRPSSPAAPSSTAALTAPRRSDPRRARRWRSALRPRPGRRSRGRYGSPGQLPASSRPSGSSR